MIKKLLSVLFLASLSFAQDPLLYCNLVVIDYRCTCNFVIFNPNGFNNLTITANPAVNCTLNDVVDATGSGWTKNVPSALCNGFPNLEKLKMEKLAVEHLNGNPFRHCYSLKSLYLSGNNIIEIPALVFSNTVLEILELDSNKITSINSLAFDSLRSLESLNLTSNPIATLNDDVFDPLESLKVLYLSHCDINILDEFWFINLFNLVKLDFSNNDIDLIPNLLFSYLIDLEWLDLSYNKLSGSRSNIFQNNTELLTLNLQNNSFTNLPANFFENQQKLTDLNLSNNPFIVITPEVIKPLVSLKVINLSSSNTSNITTWFELMEDLEVVDLSNNKITEIPDQTFSAANGIRSLNLGNNGLTTLDSRSFGSLTKLQELSVNNNDIKEIDHYLFSQSTDLLTVNFDINNCTNITTDSFNLNRTLYMNEMKDCFDNYDKNPIEITTENSTKYEWYSIRSTDGWDSLLVNVTSYENVHIALTDKIDSEIPSIEIKIGEDRDRKSFILEGGEVKFTDTKRNRLDGISFIIGWRFGMVMVFENGSQFPFMVYAKQNRFDVNFFGLRTLFTDEPNSTANWTVTRLQNLP